MKHLKTYTEFNESFTTQDFMVDDIIKCLYNGQENVAKIVSIPTQYTYIVNFERFARFVPKPIKINRTDIIGIIKNNSKIDSTDDVVKDKLSNPSSAPGINTYPTKPDSNDITHTTGAAGLGGMSNSVGGIF